VHLDLDEIFTKLGTEDLMNKINIEDTGAACLSRDLCGGLDAAGMSKARLVVTAVILKKRPASEVARSYTVTRSWVYALLARYREEGGGVRAAVPAPEDLPSANGTTEYLEPIIETMLDGLRRFARDIAPVPDMLSTGSARKR
jgi:hypothetical protein